ncbi:MAG: CNNM domain-containing protein [Pirellulaceae bacterium]
MNPDIFIWITFVAALISMAAATASQSLHQFGVHELEEYCRKRNRKEWFARIIDNREWMALSAESIRVLSTVIATCGAVCWFLPVGPGDLLGWARVVAIIVISLMVCNSWIPFAVGQFASTFYIFHTWRFWWTASIFTWPLISGGRVFAGLFRRALGEELSDEDEEEWLEDEIRSIVSEGEQDGLLEPDERDMIEGVMELDEKDVFGIMTPRGKVDALDVATAWPEAVRFVVQSGRTRIPVYEGRLDNIIGVLFAKDLLKESLLVEEKRRILRDLIREPMTVPESIMLNEMLQRFLREHTHLAVVHDEYAHSQGLSLSRISWKKSSARSLMKLTSTNRARFKSLNMVLQSLAGRYVSTNSTNSWAPTFPKTKITIRSLDWSCTSSK